MKCRLTSSEKLKEKKIRMKSAANLVGTLRLNAQIFRELLWLLNKKKSFCISGIR